MHELSLARDLLATIERKVADSDVRVVRITVSIGAATGIVPESLRFAFRVLCEKTRAEGAELSVTTVASRYRCANCGSVFGVDGLIGQCPGCGRLGGELLSGNEIVLRTIEVADV
jgi:hydrogenase nickel incorporation protein HypA/HybF